MIKSMTKKMNNKKGFTLIELVVVIAILGILAALAIPRLTGASETARENAHAANVRTIEGAASIYEANEGPFPADFDIDDLVPDYLNEVPDSPWTGGAAYTLTIATDGAIVVGGGEVIP